MCGASGHTGMEAESAVLGHRAEAIGIGFFRQQGLQGEYFLTLLRADGDAVGDAVAMHLAQGVLFQVLQVEVAVLDILLQDTLLDQEAAILLVTCGALFLLFVLQPGNPWSMDPTPERLLERLLGYTAGIVPLFAASLSLFTLNRVLHR
jgi:hypothetical protein